MRKCAAKLSRTVKTREWIDKSCNNSKIPFECVFNSRHSSYYFLNYLISKKKIIRSIFWQFFYRNHLERQTNFFHNFYKHLELKQDPKIKMFNTITSSNIKTTQSNISIAHTFNMPNFIYSHLDFLKSWTYRLLKHDTRQSCGILVRIYEYAPAV